MQDDACLVDHKINLLITERGGGACTVLDSFFVEIGEETRHSTSPTPFRTTPHVLDVRSKKTLHVYADSQHLFVPLIVLIGHITRLVVHVESSDTNDG